jgi:hypothetical protein
MKGQEFKQLVEQCGTQIAVARALGVEPDTIRARYAENEVPAIYENAIIGLLLRRNLGPLLSTGVFTALCAA